MQILSTGTPCSLIFLNFFFSCSLWYRSPRCDWEVQAWQDTMFEGKALGHGAAALLLKHFITVCLGWGTGRIVRGVYNCKGFIGQRERNISSKARRIVYFLRVCLWPGV